MSESVTIDASYAFDCSHDNGHITDRIWQIKRPGEPLTVADGDDNTVIRKRVMFLGVVQLADHYPAAQHRADPSERT